MNKLIRELFPAIRGFRAYLNTASTGLTPLTTIEYVQQLISEAGVQPDFEEHLRTVKDKAKHEVAKLIKAKPSEIAFTVQTTECIKKALLMTNPDDKTAILSVDVEFPTITSSIKSICEYRECRVLVVDSCIENEFEENVEKIIKLNNGFKHILVISSVNWITGLRLNIKELSNIIHQHEGLIIVDGVQHVGALDIDVKKEDVDILCSGAEKWLLTPYFGIGFMYVREDLIDLLELPPYGILNRKPPESNWGSYWVDPFKDPWSLPDVSRTADKYEWGGGLPFMSIAAISKSVELLNNIGVENIQEHVLRLREILVEQLLSEGFTLLSPVENANRFSPIVLFTAGKGFKEDIDLVKNLKSQGILVSYRGARGIGGIRVSPHIYNTKEEIEALVSDVNNLIRK